jgi:hypothetical protein
MPANPTLTAIRSDLVDLATAISTAKPGIVKTALTIALDQLLTAALTPSDTNGSAPGAVDEQHARLFEDPVLNAPPNPSPATPEELDGLPRA